MTQPDRTKDQFPPGGQGTPGAPGGQGAAPGAAAPAPAGQDPAAAAAASARHHKVHRSRMGGAWVGLALGAVVLVLLLVFILENSNNVKISFFGAHGHMPLGVALLLAAALGVLLVVIPGTGRIIQLRRTARRHRKTDTQAVAEAVADPSAAAPPADAGAPGDQTVANRR
jgi:uncharacterized integral membrane protein